MKQLWAPWRMDYIQGDDKHACQGCIFCIEHCPDEDAERLVLHRGKHAFVIMNKYPYSNGHLMVAPFRHIADIGLLVPEEAVEIHRFTVLCRDVLRDRFAPQGFNIGINCGQVAGAGVEAHIHQHIVPRWSGDTNFMPVFADVRVIPQHLEQTYQLLLEGFSARAAAT